MATPRITNERKKQNPTGFLVVLMLSAALVSLPSGCRSRAHNDLYQQRLASEIRILEDQLYDADYQNRVLQEKLERASQRVSEPSNLSTSPRIDVGGDVGGNKVELPQMQWLPNDSFDLEHDFDETMVDPGVAVPLDRFDSPLGEDSPLGDDRPLEGMDGGVDKGLPLPPPIGGPEPPGKSDTEFSPIEAGELLPPPDPDSEDLPAPPGQIRLPDAVKATKPKRSLPDRLELHLGLSGASLPDEATKSDKPDGLYLVVRAVDRLGVVVDLDAFEVDAELTVVALDPAREASDASIGRWEFSAEEVKELIKSKPVSGLHVPVKWQDESPLGEEVIVHIRLRSEADEMRCEGNLKVNESSMIAKWLPRSDAQDEQISTK